MSKLKWEVDTSMGDRAYKLFSNAGSLVAEVYHGGNKWYPWSWWMKDGSGRHGDSITMRNAKEAAENIYLAELR